MKHVNAAGLALIKQFEGCRLTAYRDAGGVWTIGYGHTGPELRGGQSLSQAQADLLLKEDVRRFERAVERATHDVPTTDNQFSALVSLAYNIGEAGFLRSTVLRQHRAGRYRLAAAAFLLWVKAQGKTLRGLLRRRRAEAALYRS